MMVKHLTFAVISLSVIIILFFFDVPLWQAARSLVKPDYLLVAELFTHYGLPLFYCIFAVIAVYAFVTKRRNLYVFLGSYIKAQLIFSLIAVRVLKIVVGRSRPGQGFEFKFLATSSSHNGFPSGHAADAFVSGMFLYYLLKQSKYTDCRFLPLIQAFLIAVSRVFVSAHYPSDVAAGMAIGIMGAYVFISRESRNAFPAIPGR